MTAYRSTLGSCPQCQQPLREHSQRLVCDSCQGMLVTSDDLATSIHELGAATATELEANDVEAGTTECPRCKNPMQTCTLVLGTHELKGRFLRCEADGIWLSQDQLVGELARGSRKGHAGGGSGLASAAGAYASAAPRGSAASAAAGVGRAFTQNQRTPIGYKAPRVRIAFVSAFKGRELTCPACTKQLAFRGDQWVCPDCAGTFVENAALVAMVQEISQSYWEIPASSGAVGARTCPACNTKMTVEKYEAIEIDRCATDGVWFDDNELASVLMDATTPPKSTGSWLSRLFGR
jgi:Zn-finger nucleic acid-binding protein